jgi:hypothetical protein
MVRTFCYGSLACSLLLAGGMAAAQEVRAKAQVRETSVHRSSVLVGATVNVQGGHRLGKIEDFIIDDGGCISMVVVTYGEYYVAVPWGVGEFDWDQRILALDIQRSRLDSLPTFTNFRDLSRNDFRVKINNFFNVRVRDGDRRDRDDRLDTGKQRDRDDAKDRDAKDRDDGRRDKDDRDDSDRPRSKTPDTKEAPKQPSKAPGTTPRPGTTPQPGSKPASPAGKQPSQPPRGSDSGGAKKP